MGAKTVSRAITTHGAVGDRWALDVSSPLPMSDGRERYVVAAMEYVTRYVVAKSTKQHIFWSSCNNQGLIVASLGSTMSLLVTNKLLANYYSS
jgi:hypothetical protein